jgi:hypothetical protein
MGRRLLLCSAASGSGLWPAWRPQWRAQTCVTAKNVRQSDLEGELSEETLMPQT